MRRFVIALSLIATTPLPARAQLVTSINPPATAGDVSAAVATSQATIMAAMPIPATAPPSTDTMGGATGTSPQVYALASHRHPRITDTQIVTTGTGGTFSGTYPAGFFATPPTVSVTWINGGALSMTCELSSDPTTLGFTGRCRTLSLASILAAGAGVKVHVVSIPTTSVGN